MMRWALGIFAICFFIAVTWAEPSPADSTPPAKPETLYVIPAGPVAGSFTPAARLAIDDTIAGWARVRVEGWVPVGAVLDRMAAGLSAPAPAQLKASEKSSSADRPQCAAITKKGKRCSRKAAPGSKYCWQHQPK
jgi:hypothetical protein